MPSKVASGLLTLPRGEVIRKKLSHPRGEIYKAREIIKLALEMPGLLEMHCWII